ncbi:MAG: glycosyltransferase family 4 protein [Prolixibacteraceae bacterium]
MNLVFLVSDLHLWGGGERVAVLMANHYAAKGIETTLLSVGKPGGVFRFDIDPRVKVDYLNINLDSGWNLVRKIESIYAIKRYFKNQTQALYRTSNLQGEKDPTFLLGIGNYPSLLAAIIPKKLQIKTIGCMHSPYNLVRHIWRIFRWLLYNKLDLLVSLTNRDVAQLQQFNHNVAVIPNPLTFYPEQSAKLESKLMIAVGRLEYQKGYDLMLDVFERFCRKNGEWKLKIIGDGSLKTDLQKVAGEKGIAGRLIIAPATYSIEKEYLDASIYLMTSRSEGLPMVLLEAQACGLPIIAFDCETGPAEIIHHGEDGYLIKPNDFDEMSERLLELAANEAKRKAFGTAARQNVKRFLPEEIFKQWDEVFQKL